MYSGGPGPVLGFLLCPKLASVATWGREEAAACLQSCTIQTDLQSAARPAPSVPKAGLTLPATPKS